MLEKLTKSQIKFVNIKKMGIFMPNKNNLETVTKVQPSEVEKIGMM